MMKLQRLNFIKNEKGALSIEFAMTVVGFILVLFLIYDFYVTLALQGKLDRATYSSSTIFRERAYFYQGSGHNIETISQIQTDELEKLLATLMQVDAISVKVEALYINDALGYPNDLGHATKSVVSFCSSAGCNSDYFTTLPSFNSFAHLSAYSKLNRWVPLYRVTACIENQQSLFKKMTGRIGLGDDLSDLCSSNIVISRCSGNCQTPSS